MAKDAAPITDPMRVVGILLGGDKLAHSAAGWRLVREDAPVACSTVTVLKRGAALGGRLVPMDDQLPGMPKQLAQTWRWARARRRQPVAQV